MNKLIILLKQLNIIEDVNVLLHASLKKVIVHHDNHYTFYILSKDLIPFTEYQLLLDHGLDFPYLAEFVICYDDFNFESKDVSLYLGYIIEKLKQISPLFSSLKIEDIEIKQTISIGLLNEIQLEQFQQLKSTIKKYFVEIGIEKDFSFYVKQDNDELNHLLQEMDSYEPMKIDMSEIKKSEPVKPTVDYKNNYRKPKGDATFLKLSEINSQTMENNCTIQGYVFKTELIKTRAGKHIQTLWITDYTDSIMVKRFENNTTNTLEDIKVLDKGKVWIKATGEIRLDNYARETVMMARQIEVIKEPARRQDTVEVKRVELHTHSKMSAMDGIGNVSDYINQVAKWGHKAIAVTDHGNVQSFPEAQAASLKAGIKMIYGVELNMIEPYFNIVFNEKDMSIEDATYVSFDLETTGFSVIHDGITEFGAVKIKNGEVIDRLHSFVNPGKKIGTRVSQLTNITNEMVADAPTIKEFLPQILEFFGDAILVAHNAKFDIGFLNESLKRLNQKPITNPVIDSLALARAIMKPMKSYRLGNVCRVYRVNYDDDVAHRADYDAEVLGAVFTTMLHSIMQSGNYNLLDLNKLQKDDRFPISYDSTCFKQRRFKKYV